MTATTPEWYKEQCGHNRASYELVQATWPDKFHDWNVNQLFYSALHRINYALSGRRGGRPGTTPRNRRVEGELPQVFGIYSHGHMFLTLFLLHRRLIGARTRVRNLCSGLYNDPCLMSMRARRLAQN